MEVVDMLCLRDSCLLRRSFLLPFEENNLCLVSFRHISVRQVGTVVLRVFRRAQAKVQAKVSEGITRAGGLKK